MYFVVASSCTCVWDAFAFLSCLLMLLFFFQFIVMLHLSFQVFLLSAQNLLVAAIMASLAVVRFPVIFSAMRTILYVITPLIMSVHSTWCQGCVVSFVYCLWIWLSCHICMMFSCCFRPLALLAHSEER